MNWQCGGAGPPCLGCSDCAPTPTLLASSPDQRIANAARYMRTRWADLTPAQRRDLAGEAGTLTSIAALLGARLEPAQ